MEVVQSWPPVTRVLVVATVVLSVLIHSHMISAQPWVFYADYVFQMPPKIPEIWRVLSAFCITGSGLGIILDAYFLYTYSSTLELHSPRFREHGSYFVYMAFLMGMITFSGGYLLGGAALMKALVVGLAYTFSQDNPDSNVTMFILTFPAKYLPYALLAISAVSGGYSSAFIELTGLVSAHLYDFLTRIWPTFGGGRNLVPTPSFVQNWFRPRGGTAEARSYGQFIRPSSQEPPTANTSGWNSGRGPGRRLGGEY
ncbi:DER1-domain-containing protein [Microthyrium microscopicum]|uniref:Derlin n=1 Tax=Microthyrium microscopicum TaxID=703497 RepID=A0A6A6UA85_9PEZI|nr:DER1-domain-containing protein [Microthyrium microscopicum]